MRSGGPLVRWPGLVDHTGRRKTNHGRRGEHADRHPRTRPNRVLRGVAFSGCLVDPPGPNAPASPQSRPPTPARSAALANRLAAARIHRETRDDGGLRLLLGKAHGFPGCSHSHTQPLAAGHTSLIGHQRHRIYFSFFRPWYDSDITRMEGICLFADEQFLRMCCSASGLTPAFDRPLVARTPASLHVANPMISRPGVPFTCIQTGVTLDAC